LLLCEKLGGEKKKKAGVGERSRKIQRQPSSKRGNVIEKKEGGGKKRRRGLRKGTKKKKTPGTPWARIWGGKSV